MLDLSWQKGPLGEEFERYTSQKGDGSGWTRGLANWDAIRADIKKTESNFVSRLSTSQRNSLQLLLEWWNADYQDKEVMESAKQIIREHAAGPLSDERIPSALDLKVSVYQKALFDALLYEFYFYRKDRPDPIQFRRHRAAVTAACQRLAYSTYSWYTTLNSSNESPRAHTIQPNEAAQSSGNPNNPPLGAIIEACPWLPSEKTKGMPYYLWDIENMKTVIVGDLPEPPQYTVVSHTWGRWRIRGSDIPIRGVPWNVPQNTRFEVQKLPEALQKQSSVFLPTHYIWFDLFCVPQDRSERAMIEISKQAAIFGAACRAISWLNDIEDWTGMRAGIQWLAMNYLDHSAGESYNIQTFIPEIVKQTESKSYLFESFIDIDDEVSVGLKPAGWFTSLWTLQECCLRPDMLLCNRNWEILRLHDVPGAMSVTLDSILAAVHYAKRYPSRNIGDQIPPAASEICALVHYTDLDMLLQYSRLAVLVLGNRRQCTGRRAEAIMSVIGATDWYLGTDRAQREKNLILGKYPIQFLREVHRLLGAVLFTANYGVCCFWDIFQRQEDGEVNAVVAGTLLPFDPLREASKIVPSGISSDEFDHPTTATWYLADDGKVMTPEVGIVASTEDDLDEGTDQDLIAIVFGPISEAEPQKIGIPKEENLHEWMRGIIPDLPKHAVCLRQDAEGWSQGVILMQVYDNEEPPKTFAKLGDYYTKARENVVEAQSVEVHWEIL